MPLRTRFDLLRAEARRRLRPKDVYAVRYGRGTIFLSDVHLGSSRAQAELLLPASGAGTR